MQNNNIPAGFALLDGNLVSITHCAVFFVGKATTGLFRQNKGIAIIWADGSEYFSREDFDTVCQKVAAAIEAAKQ